jgi:hypothetical protein
LEFCGVGLKRWDAGDPLGGINQTHSAVDAVFFLEPPKSAPIFSGFECRARYVSLVLLEQLLDVTLFKRLDSVAPASTKVFRQEIRVFRRGRNGDVGRKRNVGRKNVRSGTKNRRTLVDVQQFPYISRPMVSFEFSQRGFGIKI